MEIENRIFHTRTAVFSEFILLAKRQTLLKSIIFDSVKNDAFFLVETAGFEPVTSCVWSRRSNRLS